MLSSVRSLILHLLLLCSFAESFVVQPLNTAREQSRSSSLTRRFLAGDDKAARLVSGEELEMMLQEWETPLCVDAYATWCVVFC
jgi:hypothetical protein